MPPKTERSKSEKEMKKDFADATDEEYEVLNTGKGIEKTGVASVYLSEILANSGCTNGALKCWFDYVDLYVDGALVNEGAAGYKITTYTEGNYTSTAYSTIQYHIDLEFPYTLYGTYKKTMFGRSLNIDARKTRKDLRFVYYYKGNEIFSEDVVFVPKVKKLDGCPYDSTGITLDFTSMKKMRLHSAYKKYGPQT